MYELFTDINTIKYVKVERIDLTGHRDRIGKLYTTELLDEILNRQNTTVQIIVKYKDRLKDTTALGVVFRLRVKYH